MGSINHGQQTITFQYYLEATGTKFNKRNLDIIPVGIYSGGYFTKISNTEITLSPFVVEIKDSLTQVSIRSAVAATLNSSTLEAGAISSATPYIIMRWSFAETTANYLSILAISSLSNLQTNDIVVGKCVFSGSTLSSFDYTNRTFINSQDIYFKVEANTGMYVWLRAGKINNGSEYIVVPDQRVGPFTVPTSPNSRIDLVYIDEDGVVQIQQGTAAVIPVAPNHNSKLVVAQVLVVNGDTSIPVTRITDTRAFIAAKLIIEPNSITSTQLETYDSGWFSVTADTLYTKSHGLGKVPFMVELLFSDTSDGSGDVILCNSPAVDYGISLVTKNPIHVVDIDSNYIQISSSGGYVGYYSDKNGVFKATANGYARIKAIG